MITEEILITDLNIPITIKKILSEHKINTVKELLRYKISSLMKFKGLSTNRTSELNNLLNDNGFFLN